MGEEKLKAIRMGPMPVLHVTICFFLISYLFSFLFFFALNSRNNRKCGEIEYDTGRGHYEM